jgi:uncharacterized SAM-binding protein YcdF (DUF218 family)
MAVGRSPHARAAAPSRRWLVVLLTGLGLVVAVAAVALWPFLATTSDEPFAAGPVVALGGGSDARVERAADIVASSRGPRELILSAGAIETGETLGLDCDLPRVRCIDPDPVNTFGEARTVAALAADRGWSQVTVVTEPFHTTRSRLLFQRCLDLPVRVVATEPDPGPSVGDLPRGVRELVSAARSFVTQRNC